MTRVDRRGFLAGTTAAVLAGPAAVRPAAGQASSLPQGVWSQVQPWPTVAIHQTLLPNNKILSWNYEGGGNNVGESSAFVVDVPPYADPSTTWVEVRNTTTNLYCSGHAFLPDGRLLVVGGHNGDPYAGLSDVNIFDSSDGYRWHNPNTPMSGGRWYASAITLPSGDVLVLSGSMTRKNDQHPLPQVYMAATGTWRNLTGALAVMDNYPKIYVTPDGRVVSIGRERITTFLDTSGTGSWTQGPTHLATANRAYGTSVNYEPGKYLVVGGATAAGGVNTAEILDLNDAAPAWQWANPMTYGRRHPNATLLPDGKVLVTGGTTSAGFNDAAGAIVAAEMWDPATGLWSQMASAQTPRVYHSTAILLPDMRVLVAGGGWPPAKNYGINNFNAEIFWPPYFGLGPAPFIAWAPDVLAYGAGFPVITPDAGNVQFVRLISHGSVTHSFNMNQRMQTLAFTRSSVDPQQLDVQMDASANLVPPGHYMLVLVNALGVPSRAWTVRVPVASA